LTTIFHKLFKTQKSKRNDSEEDTVPLKLELKGNSAPIEDNPTHQVLSGFETGYRQSVGKQREHNEDSIFTLTTNLSSDHNLIPIGLYIVADGMGGHKKGEIASDIAVRSIAAHIINKVIISTLSTENSPPKESIQEIMRSGLENAHHQVRKAAPGSGTTVTAVLILNKKITVAHIGDSRAYIISPEGEIDLLTRDHSLVKRMIELGHLTEEEAAIHPQRNVLYRALGQGDAFSPDINTTSLPPSGYILICSDGLWGVVNEQEISHTITTNPFPQTACNLLVNAANAAGGPDNISAILIQHSDQMIL